MYSWAIFTMTRIIPLFNLGDERDEMFIELGRIFHIADMSCIGYDEHLGARYLFFHRFGRGRRCQRIFFADKN